ncbi:MAG: hypothetical protein C0594_10540, partial [Marinilabiliales bacterium]
QDPATNGEWTAYPSDDFNYIGSHTSSCIQVDIKESKLQTSTFNVYPNPNHGELTIDFTNMQNGTIQITDISGKVIYSHRSQSQTKLKLNLELQKGIYYIGYIHDAGTETKAFVVF